MRGFSKLIRAPNKEWLPKFTRAQTCISNHLWTEIWSLIPRLWLYLSFSPIPCSLSPRKHILLVLRKKVSTQTNWENCLEKAVTSTSQTEGLQAAKQSSSSLPKQKSKGWKENKSWFRKHVNWLRKLWIIFLFWIDES